MSPVYEYKCEVCGWSKEVRRTKPEPPDEVYCGNEYSKDSMFPSPCSTPMKRVLSDFQFKIDGEK